MNEIVATILALAIILLSGGLLFWYLRGIEAGKVVDLRPIKGYASLDRQTGLAVETGRVFHMSPGRAGLDGAGNPTSVASLSILDYLAEQGSKNDVPPIVTTGDGSLMIASQDSLRGAYANVDRESDFHLDMVRFQAASSEPIAYAAGVTIEVEREDLSGNIMVGRFGSEIVFVAEAAERASLEQILGSDDPIALGAMMPVTDKLLIGEELFAAAAYLHQKPISLAGLKVQDTLRLLACAGILLAAIVYLVV